MKIFNRFRVLMLLTLTQRKEIDEKYKTAYFQQALEEAEALGTIRAKEDFSKGKTRY